MTDNTLTALIAAIPPTLAALGSLFASLRNHRRMVDVAKAVNGRVEELTDIKAKKLASKTRRAAKQEEML